MNKNKTNWVAVLTMMFLFGMISFVTNLAAPIGTIWKSQPGIDGSGFWGMMGNMMNFLAYLFMGLPAGKMILKFGYKKSTLIGVAVGFFGVLIQFLSGKIGVGSEISGIPANFFVYLFGAFICGISVCILNTVVNPMLNLLGGGGNKGNQFVQIGGTFNSLMGTVTPMLVGMLIGTVTAQTQIADVNTVLYIAMGVFLATFAVLSFIPFVEPEQAVEKSDVTIKNLLKYKHLVFGVIAIFFYVGVEIGIPAELNFYIANMGFEGASAIGGALAAVYWFLMMIGRAASSVISGKISTSTQMTIVSSLAIALLLIAIFMPESVAVQFKGHDIPVKCFFIAVCGICTSIMWGGIFNLAVEGLGKYTAAASGLFMTMVVGGGIMPLIQHAIAQSAGAIASYWLVIAMLAYILYYSKIGCKNVNKDIPVE